MIYPTSQGHYEIEIEKSKFISTLYQIKTTSQTKAILKELAKEHPQARHIVYAYTLGYNGELLGKTDDGEPAGTAGGPTLNILKSNNCTGALIATVRYFGGIKLGTGGLSRAYSLSALGAFENSTFAEIEELSLLKIKLPYNLYDSFLSAINKIEANAFQKQEELFSDMVDLAYSFPSKLAPQLEKFILDLGKGSLNFSIEKIPGLFDL